MTRLLRHVLALAALAWVAASACGAERPTIAAVRIGLGDTYKLGCWAPLRVTVEGGDAPLGVTVLATAPDSDGVGVATAAPGGLPLSTEPGRLSEERLYVRIGQQNAPVDIQLLAGGRRVDQRLFSVVGGGYEQVEAGQELPLPQAAVDRLVLQAGGDVGVTPMDASLGDGWSATAVATVASAADLPRDAIGYDSFDTVVLVAGSRSGDASGGWLGSLGADDDRIGALVEWVEGGGRLVVSCGAGGAALLGPGGALAGLAPGDYTGPGALATTTAIERYADDADAEPIDLLGGSLAVSLIENPRGEVLAYAGRSADETPLVVRAPRGFGEVTFAALDLDAPALAGWKGRPVLLRRLLELPAERSDASQQSVSYYYQQDLANTLIGQLDRAFVGVRTAPFLAIVGLVLLYLLLIGPGDYFFVKKVLKRVEATWVTFPLLVALTSAAAYYGAHWLKGDRLRVNEVEIVDVDAAAGRVRGLLLTHVFSPRAARYDLRLAPRTLAGEPLRPTSATTAWLGKPGSGLGGMQAYGGQNAAGVRANYQIDPTPLVGSAGGPSVVGLPVQVWSTKSLVSRYAGPTDRVVEASLARNRDGLAEGTVTNDTGARLADCLLLYGSWAWRLGDLGDGETTTIDPSLSPLKITTLLGKVADPNTYRRTTSSSHSTVEGVAQALSVGRRMSGAADSASRYLRDLDLTHHLDGGRAVLLARVVDGPRSELVSPEGPLVSDDEAKEGRRSWVFARFILDVREE